MKRLTVITRRAVLVQKLRLALPDTQIVAAQSPRGAVGTVLYDTDTVEGEIPAGAVTVGRGAELPYPFLLSEIKMRLASADSREDPLYPLPDGSGAVLHGEVIRLTEVEMRLFLCLYCAKDYVSREELLKQIWGEDADGGVLNVYIHYLRTKLEAAGEKVIISSRGRGYRIAEGFRREADK